MTECRDRGLSTARAVLSVLSYVSESERGVSAREVAERLDKSLSTAYHLLASLEAEGFIARVGRAGRYHVVAGRLAVAVPPSSGSEYELAALRPALENRMRQVFALTGRRTCIGIIRPDGVELVQDVGRQGLPRLGNLEQPRINATAHALAIGKVLLAGFDDERLQQWLDECRFVAGLRRFTPATIVDPAVLRHELDEVRQRGVATDCCEYDADFASVAVPVTDSIGRPVAAIAVTVTPHQFAAERETLELALLRVTSEVDDAQVG